MMRRPRFSLAVVLLAAAGLIAVHEFAPDGVYGFGGHGREVYWSLLTLLVLLFVTHGLLAVVLWTQRAKWDAADAGTFRWICAKALFWINAAVTLVDRGGVNLTIAYLFVVIFATTLDLDIQMIRRYVRTREVPR